MSINIENSIGAAFSEGKVILQTGEFSSEKQQWTAHPKFSGVRLKTLINKDQSNNVLNALLVSVAAGCELAEHIHEDQLEMHEVIEGTGSATLAGETAEYIPGTIALIPEGIKHSVRAGSAGLVLLAKFFG